ncbi:MAG: NrfD/PsrC family molybdoenzyme membrane anchor subunit [Phaeovulum sp.]|jgi:formate-dependent nitrite reductase membrane component NrfD|uniref:NrfD/PsrC family molybdoenzyme membrane anchor subunit n=1 Tax=Phaeovulum sp. TaxID=2934796 RepID=UPI002734E7EE|nr:NrfD/PsrC family molybdoenzyme membrane anchor subunit [Phaeovulum sp.]MDP3861280.1 NrfD/PsrC family molybdoenzyme membrane anchor subunit [Phaeovulum sp.]
MEHELTWGLPVILYLFLAGVGSGAVTVSASVLLRGGGGGFGGDHFSMARYGAIIGPFPVMIGTSLIVLELGRPDRAFNLFKVVNLSPMNIGSWLLLLFMATSVLYALTFLPSFFASLKHLSRRLDLVRRILAFVNVPLGIGVAVYTGVMLGAMPSRPLWNSPILALLFLVSALSTGVAMIILARVLFHRKSANAEARHKFHESAYLLTASDALLIGTELMVIFLFVLFAHLTIGNVKYAVSVILPGGELAPLFWLWVVLIGLLLPVLAELVFVIPKLLFHRGYSAPGTIEVAIAIAVLTGGFMLRYVIVVGGQITGPMGL